MDGVQREENHDNEDVDFVKDDIFKQFDQMISSKHMSKMKAKTNAKKVEVSAMPGKTKVVQTLFIQDYQLKLYDCPGLVFPSLLDNFEDMYLYGILNISNCRDLLEIFSRVIDYFNKEDIQQ